MDKNNTKEKLIKNELTKSKLESACDIIWKISLVITSLSAIGFSIYLYVVYSQNKVYVQNLDKYADELMTRDYIETIYCLAIFFISLLFIAFIGLLFTKKMNNSTAKLIVLILIFIGIMILIFVNWYFAYGIPILSQYFKNIQV